MGFRFGVDRTALHYVGLRVASHGVSRRFVVCVGVVSSFVFNLPSTPNASMPPVVAIPPLRRSTGRLNWHPKTA